jgi:hypothetical protein
VLSCRYWFLNASVPPSSSRAPSSTWWEARWERWGQFCLITMAQPRGARERHVGHSEHRQATSSNYSAAWEVLEFASGSWAKSGLAWIPHIRCPSRDATFCLFGILLKSAASSSSRRQICLAWEQDSDSSPNAVKTLTVAPPHFSRATWIIEIQSAQEDAHPYRHSELTTLHLLQ